MKPFGLSRTNIFYHRSQKVLSQLNNSLTKLQARRGKCYDYFQKVEIIRDMNFFTFKCRPIYKMNKDTSL